MPTSKARKKKSNGKAWRTGRAGSEYDDGSAVATASDLEFAQLSEALMAEAADDHELYTDDKLAGRLIRRGWVAVVFEHPDDRLDMWRWPPSTPGTDGWVETTVSVERGEYRVDFAEPYGDDDPVIYETRADLLDDIEAIESYRHPVDPRH